MAMLSSNDEVETGKLQIMEGNIKVKREILGK